MRRITLLFITTICASIILAGCKTDPVADSTAPTVTATAPIDTATDVAIDPVLTVTFSEAMDETTITADTILLKQGDTVVAATVSYAEMVATVTPAAALAYTTGYTLRVTASVRDAAGNALAEAVEAGFTTATHTGAWDGKTAIETLTTPCDEPVIAASSNGTAICVFTSDTDVYAVRYDGTSWGTPTVLNSGTGSCYYPKVAVSSGGAAVAAWMQYNDGGAYINVCASTYSASAGSWSAATVLNTDTGTDYNCFMPDVAYRNDGSEAMVAWAQNNGFSIYLVRTRRYTSSWGAQDTISSGGANMAATIPACEEYPVKVVYEAHGYAIASWITSNTLMANRCVGGTWSGEAVVSSGYAERTVALSVDPLGNTYACGSYPTAGYGAINVYNGTAWSAAWGPINYTGVTNFSYGTPAATGIGDLFHLYCSTDGSINHLSYAKMPVGATTFNAAVQLDTETTTGNNVTWPSITFDSSSNGMAAWLQYNGTTTYNDLWVVRYQGTAFGTPTSIDVGDGPIPSKPSLAVGKDGKQFIVWSQNDGTYLNIYCRAYTP